MIGARGCLIQLPRLIVPVRLQERDSGQGPKLAGVDRYTASLEGWSDEAAVELRQTIQRRARKLRRVSSGFSLKNLELGGPIKSD